MAEFGMQQAHRDSLRHFRVHLVREMNPEAVLSRLQELDLLTEIQCESILVKSTRTEKNGAILDIIPKKGPAAFHKFCQALSASGCHRIRLLIDSDPPVWKLSDCTMLALAENGIQILRGRRAPMDLPFQAWCHLKEAIPNIQDSVNKQEKSEVLFALYGQLYATVSNYQEKMYVGIHKVDQGKVIKGSGMNFNMDEWTVFLQVMDTVHQEVLCSKPVQPKPNTYELIDIVYRYLLECQLCAIKEENCEGCKIDAPGQEAHMQDGCLSEWSDIVENYLHTAKEHVNRATLTEVFTQLSRSLREPMDPFFPVMLDLYLNLRTITPEDMLNRDKDICEFYREKLYHIKKNL